MKLSQRKVAKYTAAMTPEQQRLFRKLLPLPEVPTGEAVREQFHCSRSTANVVVNALADYRMTPAERKAKAKAAAAAPPVRRYFKPVTVPYGVHSAFSEETIEQRDRDIPKGHRAEWSEELNKWVDAGPWTSP